MFGRRAVGDEGLQARLRSLNVRSDRPAIPPDASEAEPAARPGSLLDEPAAAHTVVRLPAAALLDAPPDEQLADAPADEPGHIATAAPGVARGAATVIASTAITTLAVRNATVAEAVPRVYPLVIQRLDTEVAAKLERQELSRQLTELVSEILVEQRIQLNQAEQRYLVMVLLDDMLGLGPLEPLLADEAVTDIMVNGAKQVYVERRGKLELTDVIFRDNAACHEHRDPHRHAVGRRIDKSTPLVDARLPDGSRVNIIIPPLAIDGPAISIRKFSKKTITLDIMARQQNISPAMATVLKIAARARLNILISGGTGSGKTTLLNAMSQMIDPAERIVTIEDAAELQLQQPHVVRLGDAAAQSRGQGRDHHARSRPQRAAHASRPHHRRRDRGAEALDMLQAMNTGHDGSLWTIHANRPREALTRLENMVGMGGVQLPARAVRTQIAAAVDIDRPDQPHARRHAPRHLGHRDRRHGRRDHHDAGPLHLSVRGRVARRQAQGQLPRSGLRPHFTARAEYFGLDRALLEAVG